MLPDLPNWPLELVAERLNSSFHGDFSRWQDAVDELANVEALQMEIGSSVAIKLAPMSAEETTSLQDTLMSLHPWRKGPFQIGPLFIDTEWRSDWKWARLSPHLDWTNKRILDIGGGNGYFGWRMLGAGAHSVIGVDPTILFCMQHRAIQALCPHPRHWVLPLGIQELPHEPNFEIVLSMGVIYHRRDAQAHVQHLCDLVEPGGQVVLESIVTEQPNGFKPQDRYARMRNVWWIPSVAELTDWMTQCGLENVRMIDISTTTIEEQRTTPWMTFESLPEALDPADDSTTIEGYPAPVRAIVIGDKPGTIAQS